jgi:hypothetical protein
MTAVNLNLFSRRSNFIASVLRAAESRRHSVTRRTYLAAAVDVRPKWH